MTLDNLNRHAKTPKKKYFSKDRFIKSSSFLNEVVENV